MSLRLVILVLLLTFFPSVAMGLPAGGKVAGGAANISQPNGQTLNVNQLTERAIVNWKGFSINVNELVKFSQPGSSSLVLNRISGVDPSSILGRLVANGRVFIVNPNGILFGPNSAIDVAGLLATTLNINDADFMAGKFNFFQGPGKSPSYVINQGQIRVSDNGFVFLVAPGVSNEGLVIANLGKVVMGSGEKLTVDFMGDGLITFAIDGKVLNQVTGPDGAPLGSAVANTGMIKADGGQVILSARAPSEIFSSVVNNSGVIEARSLVNRGGVIRLEGSDPVPNTGEIGWRSNLGKVQNAAGRVLNSGTLDVSAREAGAAPGEVTLSGQLVGVSGSILARGADGAQGGRVLVTSSDKTTLTQDSLIDTSGSGNSSAGNAVIWSDKETMFRGTILAKGGETGGNGGQIEVSGHENLGFTGQVNALAPSGSLGSVLLDPRNITVANSGGATLAQVDQFSDTPGTNQTIAPATINAAAANVVLQANNDITVTDPIAMTGSGVGITMQAGRDIRVNAGVTTTDGNISLTANDSTAIGANRANTATGDIAFGAGANLSAGTGNIALTIDPSTTNPFNPGSITTVRNLTTTGGNISINSPNNVTLSGTVNAGSGTVTINANTDGAGGQSFTMNAGSSITTTNTTADAVKINVNASSGGTGPARLRPITTGSGGTLTVATDTGGHVTGGDIAQAAGTLLDVGGGTLNLSTAAVSGRNIGTAGANILTRAGTITASTGTSGVFITESDGANVTATAPGGGAINLRSTTGALNISGATSAGSGAITLTAETVNINNSLTSSGALTLNPVTAAGNLTVSSSSASNLSDGFSSITIGNAAGTGDVTVNALTVSDPLTIRSPTTTGTVTVNGPITGVGNASVTLTGGTGTTPITLNAGITTTGNAITLSDNTGLGANVVLDSTDGGGSPTGATISVTGTIDGAQAFTLNGGTAGNVTLSGAIGNTQPLQNLTVTSANALTVPAVTTTGNIQLNAQNAVTLNGSVNAGSGIVTINANTDGTGGQSFTMNAGSSITTTNTTADAVKINVNASSGGTGPARLRDITTGSGGALTVATDTGGNVTGGDITQTAGTLLDVVGGTLNLSTAAVSGRNIGTASANILTQAATITASSGSGGIFINNQTGVDLAGIQTAGSFRLTANGPITGSGATVVGGTTTLAAGTGNNIALNSPGNDFNTVAVSSGNNVTLVDSNALNLGASTVSGNLGVTTDGPITDSGNLTVTGTTILAAGAANDITLNNTGNNFSTVAIGSGNNVTLRDANALDLGASNVSGALNLTTGGAVTESGVLNVAGNTSFTATAANTDILLNTQSNNFGGVISFAGTQSNFRDIALRNTNVGATVPTLSGLTNLRNLTLMHDNSGVNLPTLSTAGTLNVTAGGAVAQSGIVNVAGTTNLAAGGNDITLDNSANDFNTVAVTSGNNVTLVDDDALDLGSSAITGNLNVTTNGALTQIGAVNVTGATTLAAGSGNDITLNNAGNDFNAVAVTSGNNVSLRDANDIGLGTSTVSGNFTASAGGALLDADGSAINITATTAHLTAASNIGTAGDPVETNVATLNGTANAGGIYISEADGVVLNNIVAGGGSITISNVIGDMVVNSITATGGGIDLTASAGSILDGNGDGNNLAAVADSNLRALGGVIGLITDPIEVDINSGILGVAAMGQVGGVSVDINGTVLPSGTLTLINSPPGEVIFNSRALDPSAINLPNLMGIAAELDMQRVIRTITSQTCCSMYSARISSKPSHSIVSWTVVCS